MRVLFVSNLYPPVVRGGYETGCALVAGHLQERGHEVRVLSSSLERESAPADPAVDRSLEFMTPDKRGASRAPIAAVRAASVARRNLAWEPDLIYCWNGAAIPQAALRILADSGLPLAFRVEEHWFGGIFMHDQFLRELLPEHRPPARALWSLGCRALNAALPTLRLDPTAGLRAAVTWNSEAMKRMAPPPSFVHAVLGRVIHPAPPRSDVYSHVARDPAPTPTIAFLGRVAPEKGLEVAIEAIALLREQLHSPVSLEVVGPEQHGVGEQLRALAERLGVSGDVLWLGQRTPVQAAEVLARAHALIVPSTWDEPFGYVMVEGALARVPLVASDVGGISEAMADESHALFFPRGDAAAAAAALARTLTEREQTAARVERAFERAQQFRVGPYLQEQERFVHDALAALSSD
jgi:glycosyltransferase involved in cell wall biosynthesis